MRVHAVLSDAWQAEGRLRTPFGGGAADFFGVQVMASGLPYTEWNSGHVHRPDFDLAAVRAWYAARGQRFGLRVPAGMEWRHGGARVARQRCMVLTPELFRPAPTPRLVTIRRAGPADLEVFALVDAAAFGDPVERNRAWCEPQLLGRDPRFHCLLAELGGKAVGVATGVRTVDGLAVFGVGVLPEARRCGIGSALTSLLVDRAFAEGVQLAVLNPETTVAARMYTGLGFVETGGLDIYVDL